MNMELLEIMRRRRSVRTYTTEAVSHEQIKQILQAGLLSASGRTKRPWEFIVVQDKAALNQLAECRVGSAQMLKQAAAAIAVIGDSRKSDTWIEDCSIAMSNMHLMADSLGLGSCWIQGRMRTAADGNSTDQYVRTILGFPKQYQLEAILSIGIPVRHPEGQQLEQLPMEKIHYEKF